MANEKLEEENSKAGVGNRIDSTLPIALYFIFKILTLIIPGGAIYLGYDLFIRGVGGTASLVVENKDLSGQLINAAPGLFFALFGLVGLCLAVWKGVDIDYTLERLKTNIIPLR